MKLREGAEEFPAASSKVWCFKVDSADGRDDLCEGIVFY